MGDEPPVAGTGVLLAKVRATDRLLGLSDRMGVEPLRAAVPGAARADRPGFSLDGSPQWFMVRAEPSAGPWDQAHARVAAQLGVDEGDVLFVEPDLVHSIYRDSEQDRAGGMAVGSDCRPIGQDAGSGKATGQGFAWHLDAAHSELDAARASVVFTEPPTTIAHLDTGWSQHETVPAFLDRRRQRNFVRPDGQPGNAEDPDNEAFLLDNSGHGTGTISILAGATVTAENRVLGGAPDARVVPIRIADRVVLLRTSSLARGILYASDIRCAVATLSMGGVPSKAWAEAVDDAYDLGLCLVAAAGNRFGELPPRTMVYPARYDRVVAVTGAMADGSPYENLAGTTLESCFGPDSAMGSAIAAYSPNIPWAKFGCPTISRLDGEGTSAATPQVAAAAALWIEKHKGFLPDDWRRVEAVRNALFSSAKSRNRSKFGNGILQANRALAVAPNLQLGKSGRSKHSWAVLRMLTGLAVDGESPQEEMFNLELAQLWLTNRALSEAVPDPEAQRQLTPAAYQQVLDIVLEDPTASQALRRHLRARYTPITKSTPPSGGTSGGAAPALEPTAAALTPPAPPYRRLRVFAKDPTLATAFATTSVGRVTLEIPWEPTEATATGFRSEYLDVVDDAIEAPAGATTAGLDHPHLLAQDGWDPSPGNLQFHQQTVYAVASKTIEHFERALGRPVLWSHRRVPGKPNDDSNYVQRLTVRPHAFRVANAYYSPEESSLLFGYFTPGEGVSQVPTFPVYTCLSYDIVAHETTHAILDGMYRRFAEPTNVDVLAFHEAFADIVALLQSFDLTDLLAHQIRASRGDLRAETLLGKLAVEFGHAARGREALRSAIGSSVDGKWVPSIPDPTALARLTTPHDRGAILVAAVFDAMIAIYEARTADLFRLATGGTGRLPDGAIHPDLTARLAAEAATSARHLLQMCIRALDYLPPVDVTFFDYLRALITADAEYVPDDRYDYRIAVVEAFTKRGIVPGESDAEADGLRSLSADSIRWASFDASDAIGVTRHYRAIVRALGEYADACVYIRDRKQLFDVTRSHRAKLNRMFRGAFEDKPQFRTGLGLDPGAIEVHTLRRAMRARPNGRVDPEVIVSLTQSRRTPADRTTGTPAYQRLGGATMIVNLAESELPRYRIVKPVSDPERQRAAARFHAANEADPLRALYLSPRTDQFALLHHLADRA